MNNLASYDEGRSLRERFIREFTPIVEGMAMTSMSIKGIFNALQRAADTDTNLDPRLFMNWFMSRSRRDFIKMSGFGPARAQVCLDIQNKIRKSRYLREKLLFDCKTVR